MEEDKSDMETRKESADSITIGGATELAVRTRVSLQ